MAKVALCPRCHAQMAVAADALLEESAAAVQLCCPVCDEQFAVDPSRLMQLPEAIPVARQGPSPKRERDSDSDPRPTDSTLVAPVVEPEQRPPAASKRSADTVVEPVVHRGDQSASGTVTGGGTVIDETLQESLEMLRLAKGEAERNEPTRETPATTKPVEPAPAETPATPSQVERAADPPEQQTSPSETLEEWLHRTTSDSAWQANNIASPVEPSETESVEAPEAESLEAQHSSIERETLDEPPLEDRAALQRELETRQASAEETAKPAVASEPQAEPPAASQLESLLAEFRGSDRNDSAEAKAEPEAGHSASPAGPPEELTNPLDAEVPEGQTVEFAPGLLDQLRQRKAALSESNPSEPTGNSNSLVDSASSSPANEHQSEKPIARDFGFDFDKVPAGSPSVGAAADALLAGKLNGSNAASGAASTRTAANGAEDPGSTPMAASTEPAEVEVASLKSEGTGPRKPLLRRTGGVVGGGLIGLGIGYALLMFAGDGASTPNSAEQDAAGAGQVASSDDASETPPKPWSDNDLATTPRTAPETQPAGEIQASFESPSDESDLGTETEFRDASPPSASGDDRYASQIPETTSPADLQPPQPLTPPERSVPLASNQGVDVVGAPAYDVERLRAALEGAEQAGTQLRENSLDDPESRALIGHAYAQLCELSQVITFLAPDDSDPRMQLTRLEAQDIFRRLLRYQHARDDAHETAAHWLAWTDRPHGGVFFAGLPTKAETAGGYFEYTMPLPGGGKVIALSPTAINVNRFAESKEVGIVGCIIESPTERIRGYNGDAERVIWIGHTVPLSAAEFE